MIHADKCAEALYTRRAVIYDGMTRLVRHRERLRRWFAKKNYLRSDIRALDAGCGSGALIMVLHDLAKQRGYDGVDLYGFDLTERMLDRCRAWIHKTDARSVHLVKADVLRLPEDLPASWDQFDLIVSSGMLEYLPTERLSQALSALRRLLKPNGTMVIFMSRSGWLNRLYLGGLWHANLYTYDELRLALHEADLRAAIIKPYRSWGWVIEAS